MARRKKQSAPESVKLQPHPGKHVGLYLSIAVTLVLAGIPFALGKYIEFNSPGPFDSGAFVYSAEHLLQGAKLGVDERSSARPDTLLVNIIGVALFGFNEFGPKIIQMVLQLSAFVFMFYTLRKVSSSIAAVIGTTVAAIYLSAPLIAKFGNVKEQFMIPFMIAAACCYLLYGFSQKHRWLIAAGFFAVQPYYFKPTGLSILIALTLCLVLGNIISGKRKTLIPEFGSFLIGYAAGLLVPGLLYLWQDTPATLLTTLPVVLLETGFVFGLIIAGAIIVIVFIKRVRPFKQLRHVSKWIWITGCCLIFIAFITAIYAVKNTSGSSKRDLISYIQTIPVIQIPIRLYTAVDVQVDRLLVSSRLRGGYVSNSWSSVDFSLLGARIFRYYKALSVPILLALASIIAAVFGWISTRRKENTSGEMQSKYVWGLILWWVLDMAFVWVSPRSYEQYYLPLCASGAMLSGFVIWKWYQAFLAATNKMPWLAGGLAAAITLGCLTIPIFIGQRYSPDTNTDYIKQYGYRNRGFGPALKELPSRQKGAWVTLGDYIRTHSTKEDTIYVWGWYPGIYVQAQRLAPVPNAFEGDMHVKPARQLEIEIYYLVEKMKQQPPKFIVDSRKQHFPNDRPPLELWPIVPQNMFGNEKLRLLNNNPQEVAAFDAAWAKLLEAKIEPEEAKRFEAMKPLRDFVMNNYRVAGQYGIHVLFEHK